MLCMLHMRHIVYLWIWCLRLLPHVLVYLWLCDGPEFPALWGWGYPCLTRPQFYQTRSASSMDQGSTKKRSAVHNFVPTVTKFCVMWEGLSLPQDTKFGNCWDEIVDRRVIFIWSLIHGSSWSGLIKVGPGVIWISHWIMHIEDFTENCAEDLSVSAYAPRGHGHFFLCGFLA